MTGEEEIGWSIGHEWFPYCCSCSIIKAPLLIEGPAALEHKELDLQRVVLSKLIDSDPAVNGTTYITNINNCIAAGASI